jgi:hypothetical protein
MVHLAKLNLHRHYVFDVPPQIMLVLLALIEYRYRLAKGHGQICRVDLGWNSNRLLAFNRHSFPLFHNYI